VQTPILSSVKVRRKLDPDPEPSYLGEWTDDLAEWNILRAAGDYVANLPEDYPTPSRGREYRAFRPEVGGERRGSPRYQQDGLRDYTRMDALERATRVLDSNSPPGWATYREAWETYRKVLDVPKR
jgi:hypothetical protein